MSLGKVLGDIEAPGFHSIVGTLCVFIVPMVLLLHGACHMPSMYAEAFFRQIEMSMASSICIRLSLIDEKCSKLSELYRAEPLCLVNCECQVIKFQKRLVHYHIKQKQLARAVAAIAVGDRLNLSCYDSTASGQVCCIASCQSVRLRC